MQKNVILPKEFKAPHLLSGLDASTPILVGFSGGADSSALLLMLRIYSEQSGARIYAAHVNHGIRGSEADRDERFCKELAESLGVEFFSTRLDIPAIAKESGESIESAARNERYRFFSEIMQKKSIPILATAHNADDNLETMIFNLTRGAGLGGLCGIPSVRQTEGGIVIRPILSMEKRDIVAFCNDNGINFVTDSTNADIEYTRNKIRNQIIPILKEINTGVTQNASRTAEALKEDASYLQIATDDFLSSLSEKNSIELSCFSNSHPAIINRALMRIHSELSGKNTLEAVHINAIKELTKKGIPHSAVSLPQGFDAVIENGKLCFLPTKKPTEVAEFDIALSDGRNSIDEAEVEIFINAEPNSKNIYKKSIILSIDSAKIKGAIHARSRHAGDKILSGGMHKSLKKLLNEKKIPLEYRARIPIIYDDEGILAIPFVAIRDGARPKKGEFAEKTMKITVCIR